MASLSPSSKEKHARSQKVARASPRSRLTAEGLPLVRTVKFPSGATQISMDLSEVASLSRASIKSSNHTSRVPGKVTATRSEPRLIDFCCISTKNQDTACLKSFDGSEDIIAHARGIVQIAFGNRTHDIAHRSVTVAQTEN